MKDTAHPRYNEYAELVKQFEAKYGEDWEDNMIEYSDDFVGIPIYVYKAALGGNLRTILQWLGKGNIKERVNAKCQEGGNAGLLYVAAKTKQHDMMSFLMLNGADVGILTSSGTSVLTLICDEDNKLSSSVLLLSWGAELFQEGKQICYYNRQHQSLAGEDARSSILPTITIANLMSSELGGRRCEIVNPPNSRDYLAGKTCVVEEYIEESNQYRITMEFTNEVLLLGADSLKRRDRTPQDPGYYVECKNNRLIRRDFESNEECQAFIVTLAVDEDELPEVDPEKEAKAEQAAADLLAELGLEDLERPSSSASKKEKQPVASGKKKKRGGKKKGRK